MGSGDRLTAWRSHSLGIGLSFTGFPFALTINVQLLLWVVSLGIGPAYDSPRADPSDGR